MGPARSLWQTDPMNRPDPIKDPSYTWPTARTPAGASPLEKALAAFKIGALLAGTVTIVFIYLATYSGFSARRDLVSVLVLAAFLLPSLAAYLLARRRGRKGR